MPSPKSHIPAYDTELMFDRKIGRHGMPEAGFSKMAARLDDVKRSLVRQWKDGEVGFFSIPDRATEAKLAERLAKAVAKKFRTLIVVGIGGSDLGARAIIRALAVPGKGMAVRFIGANTDPEEIAALLASVNLKECAINVISKSGDTVEPMSTFLLLRELLIKKVGVKKHAEHVIATTDADAGTLREIARREGYRTLPVPKDIGGRFSALTAVGLFPAACAGVPAKKLLAGAAAARQAFESGHARTNAALLFAGLHCDAYLHRDQRVTVLMPYADGLKEFAFWFRQLWAESLGKARDRKGAGARCGFTPVAALGATDQHSQIQLYNEGPADKVVTFIEVGRFRDDFKVPAAYRDLPAVSWMKGKRFSDIIHAERAATAQALARHGRPSGTLHIGAITPESVGALMMHFMIATAAAAELLDVNAYDQPGVEEGKRLIREMLDRA